MILRRVTSLELRDDKGDLVTDSHGILATWMNHFSPQFSVSAVQCTWG